jgi:branched-chain amino acid transport system permease protein
VELAAQQILNALALGATYALLALGLAVVFNMLGFVNFAHGELLTASAFALLFLLRVGVPWWIGAPIAVAAGSAAAVVMERVAFRPVRRASPNTLLLTSFAASVILQALFQITISPRPQAIPIPDALGGTLRVAGLRLATVDVASVGVTILVLGALAWFFARTDSGLAIRAAAEDFETTRLMGIRANRVVITAFAISGFLAGIAALIWTAKLGTVDPGMGLIPMLKAFISAVIGGIGSIGGAAAGGFVLGAIEVAFAAVVPTELLPFRDALAFVAVVVVLLIRPAGLFGKKR